MVFDPWTFVPKNKLSSRFREHEHRAVFVSTELLDILEDLLPYYLPLYRILAYIMGC